MACLDKESYFGRAAAKSIAERPPGLAANVSLADGSGYDRVRDRRIEERGISALIKHGSI